MDKIENKIDDYLSNDTLDEGLGRAMSAGWNALERVMNDRTSKNSANTSIKTIERIMKKTNDGKTLKPDIKKQLKLFNKKLEFYKEEFVKVLLRIEKLAKQMEKDEAEDEFDKEKESNDLIKYAN
jgi:hypothetical protein